MLVISHYANKTAGHLGKRLFDLTASVMLLILLSPFLFVVSAAIVATMGGPVFFRQNRIGLHGKIFSIFKFRTMAPMKTDGVDEHSNLRVTRLGHLLRRWSIDELPQLINVFLGDMSLVGPRPIPEEYRDYLTNEEQHRHDMRPGLTGLAQISGRNAIAWDKKFQFDLRYVKSYRPILDLSILVKTIFVVVSRADVTLDQQVIARSLIEERTDTKPRDHEMAS